ncbi:MAG: hypothetical protein JST26_07995 [Bacteroidetes bacterium]|nr:hypothetical protein [Bacteroidota bacterium]
MKNKKITQAVLLIFVLGVWGTIFYKIYDKLHDDEDPSLPYEGALPAQLADSQADTFQLLENYNDPFLNKMPASGSGGASHTGSATGVNVSKAQVKPPVAVNTPQIKYLGLIKNNASKKRVAVISVNGKSSLLQEGEAVDEVKLLKLLNDSVLMLFNKQKIYIRKN